METDEKVVVKDNAFLRQFEAEIEGKVVKLEYSPHPRKIFLTKLVMDQELKDRGLTAPFLEAVFDRLLAQKTRVVPSHAEVSKFFKAHKKKYKDLLPIGISI